MDNVVRRTRSSIGIATLNQENVEPEQFAGGGQYTNPPSPTVEGLQMLN